MKSFDQLARAAYEAYAKAQLNRRAFWGGNIHPWECLKHADRACWVEAAKAVATEVATRGCKGLGLTMSTPTLLPAKTTLPPFIWRKRRLA